MYIVETNAIPRTFPSYLALERSFSPQNLMISRRLLKTLMKMMRSGCTGHCIICQRALASNA